MGRIFIKFFIFSLLVSIFSFSFLESYAQRKVGTKNQALMREALDYMDMKDYEAANETFREMLRTGEVLPTSMTYHFAETLYMLKQYQNSQNFLEKYLELTGENGDYFQEAKELKELLANELDEVRKCKLCTVLGYRLRECLRCEGHGEIMGACLVCNGEGKVPCKKCDGKGVIIRRGAMGATTYQSCDRCENKGYHTCDNCHGEKEIMQVCPVCIGSGQKITDIICDHKE